MVAQLPHRPPRSPTLSSPPADSEEPDIPLFALLSTHGRVPVSGVLGHLLPFLGGFLICDFQNTSTSFFYSKVDMRSLIKFFGYFILHLWGNMVDSIICFRYTT